MWVQMLKKNQTQTPSPYTHVAVTETWNYKFLFQCYSQSADGNIFAGAGSSSVEKMETSWMDFLPSYDTLSENQ